MVGWLVTAMMQAFQLTLNRTVARSRAHPSLHDRTQPHVALHRHFNPTYLAKLEALVPCPQSPLA